MDDQNPNRRVGAYARSGVDEPREQRALAEMLKWIKPTRAFRRGIGQVASDIGHFASVLDLGNDLGLVLTTDGVGTKLLIAQALDKYDTIGIDCIANNVNDILCLGAEPIALLDYIAINTIDEERMTAIAVGLHEGAKLAHISIPGGEIAQMPDALASVRNEGIALDLVGSAVGVGSINGSRRDLHRLINGESVKPGDLIVGLRSSGLHSNGFSMVRRILMPDGSRDRLSEYMPELGCTLGEELLRPTFIYVDAITALMRSGLDVHGLVNVSGGGLLSLGRLPVNVAFIVDQLPGIPPIFEVIRHSGEVDFADMFAALNMGIGFCVLCPREIGNDVCQVLKAGGAEPHVIGHVMPSDATEIQLREWKLVGRGEVFEPSSNGGAEHHAAP